MKNLMSRSGIFALALLVVCFVPIAWAQLATGNIYGTVTDNSGAAMAGATVTISGPNIGSRSTTADRQGNFHFLNLDPGNYRVSVSLSGFTTVNREVIVNSGINVELAFNMKVAGVEEVVTVTADTPVVDTKKTGTLTTLTSDELSKIPNARDPWAILRTVPGITVDRVNIAGNESGQQATFSGKGSSQADTVWVLDGVVISDPSAAGSSPAYYDFDAFEEITYQTGGNDIKLATGGIGINFVTKRGTNSFHGDAHGFLTDHKLETGNLPAALQNDPRLRNADGSFRDRGDHIEEIADYGANFGGPIVKDKLWFWGSYGKQDIRLQRLSFGTSDKTLLKSYNGKLNWQASQSDMVSFTYFNNEKLKFGRTTSQPLLAQTDSHLSNQVNAYANGLHGLFKIDENHIFSPSFTVDAKYAYYDTGFGFVPRGGIGGQELVDLVHNVASGSSQQLQTTRPTHTANLDANYFVGRNEFKVGFGYRTGTVTSSTLTPGNGLTAVLNAVSDPLRSSEVRIVRGAVQKFGGSYVDGYIADTYTAKRVTVNLGARFDHQTAKNLPSTSPANTALPSVLPAVTYDGSGPTITFNDLSPRLGVTYAFDDAHKSVARLSFARYTAQLNWGDVTGMNPAGGAGGTGEGWLTYHWTDLNGDGFAQPNEVDLGHGQVEVPIAAGLASISNQIDPNYHAYHDYEGIAGFEQQVGADFSVGAAYTWRRQSDYPFAPFIGLHASDFSALPPVSANGFTAQPFTTNASFSGGVLLTNRPDFHRTYSGIELTANRRLSHGWMGRVAVTYNDWKESITGPGAIQNPTAQIYDTYGAAPFGTATIMTDALVNGGQAVLFSSASGNAVFFNSKWSVSANALYQLPAGFELSGSLYGRQGFPRVIFQSIPEGNLGTVNVISVPQVDAQREPSLWDLDLRLAKNFRLGGSAALQLTADLFNVFNSGTVLISVDQANAGNFGQVNKILSPRIARFGLRFSF
jgi:hypothetical protein